LTVSLDVVFVVYPVVVAFFDELDEACDGFERFVL